jgi:hypothetical protein
MRWADGLHEAGNVRGLMILFLRHFQQFQFSLCGSAALEPHVAPIPSRRFFGPSAIACNFFTCNFTCNDSVFAVLSGT